MSNHEPRQRDGTKADREGLAIGWIVLGLVVVNFAMLTVAIGVGAIVLSRVTTAVDAIDDNSTRIFDASLAGCQRVQLERERLNVVEATVYVALKDVENPSFASISSAMAWSPPVNCLNATTNPSNYQPPEPVPFTQLPKDYPREIIEAAKRQLPQPPPRPGP